MNARGRASLHPIVMDVLNGMDSFEEIGEGQNMSQRSYDRVQHTRRQLIKRFGAAAGVFVAAPLLFREAIAQVSFADDPFQLGVASGEAAGNGFVIWTQIGRAHV